MRTDALLDALGSRWSKWDPFVDGRPSVSPEPLVLPRADWEELGRLARSLAALGEKTGRWAREDPAAAGFLGITGAVAEAFRAGPALRRWTLPGITRADFFRTASGWVVSELNTDCPGGHNEAEGLSREVGDARPALANPTRLLDAVVSNLAAYHARPTVGLLLATVYAEDLQVAALVEEALQRRGIHGVRGDPDNLEWDGRRLALLGEPVDVVYRFYPTDWLAEVPGRAPLLKALAAGAVRVVNDFSEVAAQSKRVFALWQGNPDRLSAAERALVAAHVPATEAFDPARADRYRQDREGLVLKRVWGRMGEDVLLGDLATEPEWDAWLSEAAREPGLWAVQERFRALPTRHEGRDVTACVGVYLVGGEVAGAYTRVSESPHIGYDAVSVATLVEP
ncbi:MAG: glutathionylspermidine synthase family protein [Planctomycetales bacterium]|nr:glutathionylspermidine synthase family protein [Planctomycetales bacterium]